jgi:hypothetical protein
MPNCARFSHKCRPTIFGLSMRRLWSASTTMLLKNTLRAIKSPISKETVLPIHAEMLTECSVARQQKILHPNVTGSLKMFEPQDSEMYFPDSDSLNGARFCEFHNSPLFNPVQVDLWQRIHSSITRTLSLHDRVDLRSPTGRFHLKINLEDMSKVLNTNHIHTSLRAWRP